MNWETESEYVRKFFGELFLKIEKAKADGQTSLDCVAGEITSLDDGDNKYKFISSHIYFKNAPTFANCNNKDFVYTIYETDFLDERLFRFDVQEVFSFSATPMNFDDAIRIIMVIQYDIVGFTDKKAKEITVYYDENEEELYSSMDKAFICFHLEW